MASETISELETPALLIAMPHVLDPFFHKSVVFLIEHHDEGSLGLIINRPTEVAIAHLLAGIELEWHGNREATVNFGGPVQPQVGTTLFQFSGEDETIEESSVEIMPNLRVSQNVGLLENFSEKTAPAHIRVFLGYAGWGGGQLDGEMQRNDWLVAPVDEDLLFTFDSAKVWEAALASIGVKPEALPTLMMDDGGEAN